MTAPPDPELAFGNHSPDEESAKARVAALVQELTASKERVAQLEQALESRVVIEQAKGRLAERFQISPEQAFALLRGSARSARMNIHLLARDVMTSRITPDEIVREIREMSQRHRGVAR